MIELIWPNGEHTTGVTFEEIELAARAAQWSPYPTRGDWRLEMLKRAEVWSGYSVSDERAIVKGSSEQFIRTLCEGDLFMIIEEDESEDPREYE